LLETKRILREIKILKAFKHDNIIGLRDILNLCPREKFNEIYLVNESMESDLHQIISSDQILTEDHIQFFMYQLLCGVKVKKKKKISLKT
jgi:serine/threonine protein kinase